LTIHDLALNSILTLHPLHPTHNLHPTPYRLSQNERNLSRKLRQLMCKRTHIHYFSKSMHAQSLQVGSRPNHWSDKST